MDLPTGVELEEVDGQIVVTDLAGQAVARFKKGDVMAYSANPEKLSWNLDPAEDGATGKQATLP